MESRMQILDRLSKNWGQRTNPLVENFEDFCLCFDYDAIWQLVYIAMAEYSNQSSLHSRERNREQYTKEKMEELMMDSMKENWGHCFIDDKLVHRPKDFEKELKSKVEGANIMLKRVCWLKSDLPEADDILQQFLKNED